MSADRAYLIVSQTAHLGKRTRSRTRAAWSDRALLASTRRPRPASQGPVRPRTGHPTPTTSRTDVAVAGIAALVRRRRRPGRHRLGTPGLRHYRTSRREAGVLARPRTVVRRTTHQARHTVSPRGRLPVGSLPRFASLLIVLATLLVSGWFAVSGAAAFAQMIQP